MFEGLGKYGVIYCDPPWHFKVYSMPEDCTQTRHPTKHYKTMTHDDLCSLPVQDIALADCVLLMWATWPMLTHALEVIESWGFTYKTCGFDWMKADVSTIDLFPDPKTAAMTLGYWTRSNSEPCLLATKGKPKRASASVRMGIIEPRREHSRKPDCVYDRIERLVDGPYCELFARTTRKGWDSWGNDVGKFGEAA